MGINESTVKHLNYFYNRIILVLLVSNDVKVNSGLVFLYMDMQFDTHICGTSLCTLRSQAWLRNHVTLSMPFKASPLIPLDPIKTLYSVT